MSKDIDKTLIRAYKKNAENISDIIVFDEVDSTNNVAKQLAMQNADDKTLVIAKKQTSGRGRMGRSFVSDGSGIYLSVILRPKHKIDTSLKMTAGAAVAVRRILSKFCSDVKIKWVNDVYISGRKVCGILTEATSDFESGIQYMIVGIGINVFGSCMDFGDELSGIVTTLEENCGCKLNKNELIASIYDELIDIYNRLDDFDAIMAEYKEHSMVIGKDVYMIRGDEKKAVKITDIDSEGALIATDDNNNIIRLSSGEISIRF